MLRMKFLLPAAALILAGATSAVPAQAAPVALPGAVEAVAHGEAVVDQVKWRRFRNWHIEQSDSGRWNWRRHRHHHHHHHSDHNHHRRDHHNHHHHRNDRHR